MARLEARTEFRERDRRHGGVEPGPPEPVFGPRGVVAADRNGARTGPLLLRFRSAAMAAANCSDGHAAAEDSPSLPPDVTCFPTPAGPDPTRDEVMKNFMRAGYALVYADCSDYFAVAGRNQSRSRILRDSIAPISALITGIISLRSFANPDGDKHALTILSLVTTGAASGLDVYDQNFLFGTNNIDAVRELTTRALANNAELSLNTSGITFEQAVLAILDNQAICRPSHILTLTRQAITSGRPDTTDSSNPATPPPPPPPPPLPPPPPPRSQLQLQPQPQAPNQERFRSTSTNVPQ